MAQLVLYGSDVLLLYRKIPIQFYMCSSLVRFSEIRMMVKMVAVKLAKFFFILLLNSKLKSRIGTPRRPIAYRDYLMSQRPRNFFQYFYFLGNIHDSSRKIIIVHDIFHEKIMISHDFFMNKITFHDFPIFFMINHDFVGDQCYGQGLGLVLGLVLVLVLGIGLGQLLPAANSLNSLRRLLVFWAFYFFLKSMKMQKNNFFFASFTVIVKILQSMKIGVPFK